MITLLSVLLLAQLELQGAVVRELESNPTIIQFEGRSFISGDIATKGEPIGLFRAKTEAANVEVEVSDLARKEYTPIESTDSTPGLRTWKIDKPGTWFIEVTAIDFAKNIYSKKKLTLELGQGPTPPPGPGPNPGPAPIDGVGLRVLMIVGQEERSKLTSEQQQILFGPITRTYLNKNCVMGPDGKTSEWRILDPDEQYSNKDNAFGKALKRPRQPGPWLIVSNGVAGYEGPLPNSVDEFMLTVDQFVTARSSIHITMYSNETCGACKHFMQVERAKLGGLSFEEVKTVKKSAYPTFDIHKNGQKRTLIGNLTAEQLLSVLKEMQ